MASHHLPHQPHHSHSHLTPNCCCNYNFTTPCFQPHHHPSSSPPPPSPLPPPPPITDSLLQAIASHIIQSSQFQHYSHNPKIHSRKFQFQQEIPETLHSSTISSLLSRIETLESSLHQVSSFSNRSSFSLRDLAARTIQSRFRAFLVRRSITLRQLKELAIIKSSFDSLKLLLSRDSRIDLIAVSRQTMDLLLDLDSIQGNDPMIRDSKRSISGDLVRFLERIDNLIVKRNGSPLKAVKNLRLSQNVDKSRVRNTKHGSFGGNQKEALEKLKSRVERICKLSRIYEDNGEDSSLERFHHVSDDNEEESSEVFIKEKNNKQTRNHLLVHGHKIQPGVKKCVRFAEDGNMVRIFDDYYQRLSNEDDNLDGGDSSDEFVENARYEAKEIKEFSEVAEEHEGEQIDGGSSETSDGERKLRRKMAGVDNYEIQGKNGDSSFSAPVPLKMEIRKPLKISG